MSDERSEWFRIFNRFSPKARHAVATAVWTGDGGRTNAKSTKAEGFDFYVCPIARAQIADGQKVTTGFPGSSTIAQELVKTPRYLKDQASPAYYKWRREHEAAKVEATEFYSRWDAGHISASELYDALEALGFPEPETVEPVQSASEFVGELIGAELVVEKVQ